MKYPRETQRKIASTKLILQATVGSEAHGLNLYGKDDHDIMGICIEPLDSMFGLYEFEQFIHRTAEEREKHSPTDDQRKHGRTPRSQPGDTDAVYYSLRKYVRLAAAGNPSILILLFATPTFRTESGAILQQNAHLFASRRAGHRFLGYLEAQRQRLVGQRGQMRVTRTDLINEFGYDTKYAMHMLRLGYQGIEFLTKGKLSLPMEEPERQICMRVRRGEFDLGWVIAAADSLEWSLKRLLNTSHLPEEPDMDKINQLLVRIYKKEQWELDAT